MISDVDVKVLSELNRIVARHGPDPLMRLAGLIRDPQRAGDLAAVLESVAAQAANTKSSPNVRRVNGIGMAVLNDLKAGDPQKYEAIVDFRERLVSGTFLPSMSDIRQFSRVHDLSIGNASSRKAAIPPLLRSVSELETSAIVALLGSVPEPGGDDRSLERWRELIVKPRGRQGNVAEQPATY